VTDEELREAALAHSVAWHHFRVADGGCAPATTESIISTAEAFYGFLGDDNLQEKK
jgi:hypothetical protein